ncbi:MAG: hypothetical protein JOY93_07740 [Acidobacteriales bacterium]|nr:hypothetical protein [Terriglobales bacterium]
MRLRIYVSCAIGTASGLICWFLMVRFQQGAADFGWAIRLAQSVVARGPLYQSPLQQYPVTAALFGMPFILMRPEIAAGAFYGISSGLLAFGLTRDGYRRLLIFLAYPYWAGILTAQWAPLIMASSFFPLLLPATMAKPQIGLPVALTHLSRRGVLACVAVLVFSMCLMPLWPLQWVGAFKNYTHFIPLLVGPGFLILLTLWRYRDRDAWLLVLMAIMPQRWFYDELILWLIPKTRREVIWTVFLSWGAGIWRWYHALHTSNQVGWLAVLFFYLPMMAVVLARNRSRVPSPAYAVSKV